MTQRHDYDIQRRPVNNKRATTRERIIHSSDAFHPDWFQSASPRLWPTPGWPESSVEDCAIPSRFSQIPFPRSFDQFQSRSSDPSRPSAEIEGFFHLSGMLQNSSAVLDAISTPIILNFNPIHHPESPKRNPYQNCADSIRSGPHQLWLQSIVPSLLATNL